MNPNLLTYTDKQLEELHIAVVAEQERRANIKYLPTILTDLSESYYTASMNEGAITAAIADGISKAKSKIKIKSKE